MLTIYKASAGSGKTFRLVTEYIKLALTNTSNSSNRLESYKHILAVTFTNKATSEMKNRIVDDLFGLSKGDKKQLADIISNETSLTHEEIANRSKKVLSNILHDYDNLSISTIDSFFQKILRGFTHELGLYGSFEVEVDPNLFISEACDRLLSQTKNNKDLTKWLLDMSVDQLKNGNDWQYRSRIMRLSKEIEKEKFLEYMVHNNDIADERKKLESLKLATNETIGRFKGCCIQYGKQALDIISKNGLSTTDFKGAKNSFANFFKYLENFSTEKILNPNNTTIKAVDNIENWATKSQKALMSNIENAYNNGLNRVLSESIDYIMKNRSEYITARLISKNIYALGVLSELMDKKRELGKERNAILISETNQLLKAIISDNDAPFIYEKTGNFYNHFMIDEFQDTSAIQWDNLRPLVDNSLAEGNSDLVVGDVKQSIYRWRNGDWRLLGGLINNDLEKHSVEEVSLNSNWRSSKEVVDFNNYLFKAAPPLIQQSIDNFIQTIPDIKPEPEWQDQIEKIFSDAEQVCKSNDKPGEVQVVLWDKDSEEDSFEDFALKTMIANIERLQKLGYRAGDMAILIRNNKDSAAITKALSKKKSTLPEPDVCYDFVSDDSLYLAKSSLVKFVMAMFRYILHPYIDKNEPHLNTWSALAISEYCNNLLPKLAVKPERLTINDEVAICNNFSSTLFDRQTLADYFPFTFDENFVSIPKRWANYNPASLLAELEKVYGLSLVVGEQANLQALRDTITEFSQRESPTIFRFVNWWDDKGSGIKVQTGSNRNAISIVTIHKSKGLEYPIVFIPFCKWTLNPNHSGLDDNILWCNTTNSKFKAFPILPISITKDMKMSDFACDYVDENIMSNIDNLNLLYVALTRAANGLFITTEKAKETKDDNVKISSMSDLITALSTRFVEDGIMEETSKNTFTKGFIKYEGNEREITTATINLSDYKSRGNTVCQSLKIKRNYENTFDDSSAETIRKTELGKNIHELLSIIITKADTEKALKKMLYSGKIETKNYTRMKQLLESKLESEMVSQWFDGSYKIITETSILTSSGELFRPDRVMENESEVIVVDYKTSAKPSQSHNRQVATYMQLLQSMYNKTVSGYIWYILSDELVKVDEHSITL